MAPKPAITEDQIRRAIEKARERAQARIDSIDLEQHRKAALAHLDDNFAWFLCDVLNMGKMAWSSMVPTAAVYLPQKGAPLSDFKFICNPTFAALLEPEDLAFIMGHETLHVLLNHLRIMPQMVKKGAKQEKVNIAADLVINNFLRDQGLGCSPALAEHAFFGEDWCGYNTANATVRQVYRDIDQDKLDERAKANSALSAFLDELGIPATGDHSWIYDQESLADVADKIGDKVGHQGIQDKKDDEDNKQKKHSAGAGTEAEATKRFTQLHNVSLRWAELLRHVSPDFLRTHGPAPTPSFHTKPRKLTYLYERSPRMGAIPVARPVKFGVGDMPCIAMYLDGSGSCSDYIDKFVTLAKSVPPEKIKLIARSFSTYVQPMDIADPHPQLAQGGTEFSIIEDDVLNTVVPLLGHYPKAIVVLTDGEGCFSSTRPRTQDAEKWLWLIKGNYSYKDRCGKDIPIDHFVEGMF